MMDAIASASMNMSAAQFSVQYSMAMERKAMDTMEMAAQELLEMLPAVPAKGQYIDTYA
nr:YjfB family protein [uncultured Oscillibacter sp.]